MSKICDNCGKTVNDDAKFCPYCKNKTFRNKYEVTTPNDDIVHKAFYWQYSGGSVLSKTKIASISVFAFFFLMWLFSGAPPIFVVITLIFALATYLLGFAIHKFLGEPAFNKIRYNDYGLIQDLKHLLFYWQDRTGGYILSKTKIFSFAVFLLVFGLGLTTFNSLVVFSAILLALLFEIPVFVLGFLIHKLTLSDTSQHELPEKKVKPKKVKDIKKVETASSNPQVIPEYVGYLSQLDDLNGKFASKEKSTRDLIEKRFEPPQLTYTRFISGVDKSSELFKKHSDSAYTMINLADEYSPRIAGEVETKIDILKSIIEKLDDLSNELILNNNLSNKDDVDNLINDMDNLIDSVKDYEQ